MKIAIPQHGTLPLMHSIAATLTSIPDLNIIAWIPDKKPVFDMLEEVKPDLIICPNTMLSQTFIQAIQEYNINIVVFGMCQSSIPNLKLICLDETTSDHILQNIQQESIPYYIFKSAGNIAQLNNISLNNKYKSDILYISDTDISKKSHIDKTLRQLLELEKYQIKICGGYRVQTAEYIVLPS